MPIQEPQQNTAPAPIPAQQPTTGNAPDSGSGSLIPPDVQKQVQEMLRYQQKPRLEPTLPPLTKKAAYGGTGEHMAGLVPLVGGIVQGSVKAARETQINQIASSVRTLISKYEFYQQTSANEDEAKQKLVSDPQVRAIMDDKKFQKGMAKVFGGGFLEPEKQNTVFHEGFSRAIRINQAEQQVKQARDGQQQFQQDFAQKVSHLFEMLPKELQSPTAQSTEAVAKMSQDKTQLVYGSDGSIYSVDKTNPKNPVTKILDKDGNAITSEKQRHDVKTEEAADARVKIAQQKADQEKQNMSQRYKMFQENEAFKRWQTKFNADTRMRIANMNQMKPAAALQTVAVFARTGLSQLQDAREALSALETSGALGTVLQNHLEDAIFNKGFSDPRLTAADKKNIGKVRAALGYTSSAAMRAHTGRTSREIYDDFKRTTGIAQQSDALYGALDQTENMLRDYSDVLTPEKQQQLRQPAPDRKVLKKGEIPN